MMCRRKPGGKRCGALRQAQIAGGRAQRGKHTGRGPAIDRQSRRLLKRPNGRPRPLPHETVGGTRSVAQRIQAILDFIDRLPAPRRGAVGGRALARRRIHVVTGSALNDIGEVAPHFRECIPQPPKKSSVLVCRKPDGHPARQQQDAGESLYYSFHQDSLPTRCRPSTPAN